MSENDDTFQGMDQPQIHTIRGEAVVLDSDVAKLFDVKTARLNEQVSRNEGKFEGFAFRLSREEWNIMKSQNATSSHGGRRSLPRVFTEHGVVMAATVLKSDRAATASRFIVKTFVAARRTSFRKPEGQNLPANLDPRDVLPISADSKFGLIGKLEDAIGRILDAIADPQTGTTVRDEMQAFATESIRAIKDQLKKQGIANEKTLAEIRKLLKEADLIQTEINAKQIEAEHRKLALIAKQLRIVLGVERYFDTGDVDALLKVLQDLGGD